MQKQYNLSREAASKLLKVSIRTLDRYLKNKKLSSHLVDGRIWLEKDDVKLFKLNRGSATLVDEVDMSTSELSTENVVDNVDNVEVIGQDFVDNTNVSAGSNGNDEYKNLYIAQSEELKEKQDRLEIANYRVGQLEAQLKSSVPMLEYHREKYEIKREQDELKNQINESKNLVSRLSISIKYERFSKRVFLIILLIIMALQPLWLLLYFNPSE